MVSATALNPRRASSTARMAPPAYPAALGVVTLLQYGEGLHCQGLVQSPARRLRHDCRPGHVAEVVDRIASSAIRVSSVESAAVRPEMRVALVYAGGAPLRDECPGRGSCRP